MSGDELMRAGAKALAKTTFFGKAKPDYEEALQNFEQAANAFRNAREFSKAAEALQKAAECHMSNTSSVFLAAKAYETAANLYAHNLNDPQRAAPLYQQASQYFVAHGSADRGGEMLEKAAKGFESSDPDRAIKYYAESCTIYEDEDRLRFGLDVYKRAVSFCLRSNKHTKAIEFSTKLEDAYHKLDNQNLFPRQVLTNVVLYLASGKEAAAQSRFEEAAKKSMRFSSSTDGQIANDLILSFQTGDEELLNNIKQSSPVRFLDNDVVKVAKELKIPPGRSPGTNANAAGGGGGAQSSEAIKDIQNEIEEEGYL